MKRRLLFLLALVVVLSLVIGVPVSAEKPAPKLVGQMDLSLTAPDPPDPGNVVPGCRGQGTAFTWRGTVAFEELPGTFGMVFIKLGTGKAFDELRGSVSFFTEIWAIYDIHEIPIPVDGDGCPDIDAAAIWGYDSGVTNFGNGTYRMNGGVEFVDVDGPFLGWDGRKVHMSGTIDPGDFPVLMGPGTFRLN